ncbi:MAG TPA: cation-transporting P-type ATPase, partial [Planctomycetota bacterium]|nr:cation-transporting P-type ATPase [Planctomycetota bacterium]
MSRPWHARDGEDVLAQLSSSRSGLSPEEAARRLAQSGPNELRQAGRIRPAAILLGQFKGLIVWVLVAAAGVSAVVGEWMDGAAILAIVLVNGIIGFVQEYKAETSLAALRRLTAPRARVRRGGASRLVPAADVVPGDVLELEAGDLVPADARLLEAAALRVVEAGLTGESEPVAQGHVVRRQRRGLLVDRLRLAGEPGLDDAERGDLVPADARLL